MNLLEVDHLTVEYWGDPPVRAVDDVSFRIEEGTIFGLAGESGCGKTTVAMSILGLLSNGEATAGSVRFKGTNLLELTPIQWQQIRWKSVSMVAQNAMSALNPVLTIEEQLIDTIIDHGIKMSWKELRARAKDMLSMVEMDSKWLQAYPHELSGGMRQRAMIAMALILHPELVIMDEPTTALDVVVQAQIIRKIKDLQKELGFSVLFITHDMSLLLSLCDQIAIMYAGEVVEQASSQDILKRPAHPYTRGLSDAFPSLHGAVQGREIPGNPPDLARLPAGCRFHPRCAYAEAVCRQKAPPAINLGAGHTARCHLLAEEEGSHDIVFS